MFELKITGATQSELIANAAQMAQLLVGGARFTTARANENAIKAETVAAEVEVKDEIAKPKRGRPPTKAKEPAQQLDLEEAIAAKTAPSLPEGGDPIPDLTGKGEPDKPAKAHTIEDCRDAVRQVFENYTTRAKAAGETDEAKLMAGKTAYAKPLVYGFGVQKIPDLKPEQYAAFIAAAQPYIDGTIEMKDAA